MNHIDLPLFYNVRQQPNRGGHHVRARIRDRDQIQPELSNSLGKNSATAHDHHSMSGGCDRTGQFHRSTLCVTRAKIVQTDQDSHSAPMPFAGSALPAGPAAT
jgi:hypothetical protein